VSRALRLAGASRLCSGRKNMVPFFGDVIGVTLRWRGFLVDEFKRPKCAWNARGGHRAHSCGLADVSSYRRCGWRQLPQRRVETVPRHFGWRHNAP